MSTFADRPNTALVVIDVQTGVVAAAHERDAVVGRIADLVDRARAAGTPVVWVQHSDDELERGSDAWQIVEELSPADGEPVVAKQHCDSFEGTVFADVLAAGGIGKLIVSGAQTDACVRATIHGAFARGYDTVLVSDAHTTEDLTEWGAPPPGDVIAHMNLSWRFQSGVGKTAEVVGSNDLHFT